MQVIVATYTHKHGSDVRVFQTPLGAQTWKEEIADTDWEGLMTDPKPEDRAEMADAYFDRAGELGNEFFETEACEVEA